MAPKQSIAEGMYGKVPVFTATVKVRRRTGPEDAVGSPEIFAELFEITPCNAWIFCKDVLTLMEIMFRGTYAPTHKNQNNP
jgi:hypothetical protein